VNDPGYSIWIILVLVALLFVVLWGILVAFLAFGTWMIVRIMPSEDDEIKKRERELDRERRRRRE
jgi:hypothetical protein